MPILIPLPPSPMHDVHPLYELVESPTASGIDGHQLMRQFEDVYLHWIDRNEREHAVTEIPLDTQLQHVPFREAGVIKVRFLAGVSMQPRSLEHEGTHGE